MNAGFASWTYPEFCTEYKCKDSLGVHGLLLTNLREEVKNVAAEAISNCACYRKITEAVERVAAKGRAYYDEEVEFLACYLENMLIAKIWEQNPDNTFYGVVSNVIGDGTKFLNYLEMLDLLFMTYPEFVEHFGCKGDVNRVTAELREKHSVAAAWCMYGYVETTKAWSHIYAKADSAEKGPEENITDILLRWFTNYLNKINIGNFWDYYSALTFGDCIAKALGSCEELNEFIK